MRKLMQQKCFGIRSGRVVVSALVLGAVLHADPASASAPGAKEQAQTAPKVRSGPAAGNDGGDARPAPASADKDATIELWLKLSEPAPSAAASAAEQRAQFARVQAQQRAVGSAVAGLGGKVVGNVERSSNQIAIAIAADKRELVRSIDGVVSVRPVTHRHRINDAAK